MREYGRPQAGGGTGARRRGRGARSSPRALLVGLKVGVGLLLGAASLLWAGIGLRHLGRLSYFGITNVAVRGNSQVGTAEIVASLDLRPGTSILEPDLTELRRRVLANPWIREARVARRLPLTLEVVVWERTPEVLLVAERSYLAGGDGVILAEAAGAPGAPLPGLPRVILPGGRYAPGDRTPGETVPRALALWRAVAESPASRGERLQEIRQERDGTFTVRTERGVLLRVRGEDAARQIIRLEAALQHAGRPLRAYEAVDLRFGDRIVLRAGAQKGG